ncbi:MAG: Cro/Cl family transcriptional regulator [Burkholderiales bacterium 66-5]|nr:MAG: Cro/Cl family transcriptional regulator [Burkholderiales bacterium 66-5]
MNAFHQALDNAGGPAKLAALLGCSVQAVCFWRDGLRRIPAERCPDIERLTGVRCEELRPDVNWTVLRGAPVGEVVAHG